MTAYRKRFVLITMSLLTAVLLVVFVSLGVYLARDNERQLRFTMEQVLKPLGNRREFFGGADSRDENAKGALPEGETLPEPSDNGKRGAFEDRLPLDADADIAVVFYDTAADSVTVVADGGLTADLETAARQIAADGATYGKLSGEGLLYCKAAVGTNWKIAVTPAASLTRSVLQVCLLLALAFLAALLLFFVVTFRLSKFAARPLEESIARERQFVADASHDLKTPLTVILADSSILRENPDSTVAEQMQWVESVEDAARNMQGMINEMLTLSSVEQIQEKSLELVRIDFSSIATKAVLQMESVAYDKGVALDESIDDGVFVDGSAEYLQRVCSGLIDNALKYEPEGGRIRVALGADKKHAVLEVQNYGLSVSPDDLPHLFERFYRSDKSRGQTGGHGLGLAIAKQMTEAMNGTIACESTPEIGTLFRVTLPLA